jgi:hypothetical protein
MPGPPLPLFPARRFGNTDCGLNHESEVSGEGLLEFANAVARARCLAVRGPPLATLRLQAPRWARSTLSERNGRCVPIIPGSCGTLPSVPLTVPFLLVPSNVAVALLPPPLSYSAWETVDSLPPSPLGTVAMRCSRPLCRIASRPLRIRLSDMVPSELRCNSAFRTPMPWGEGVLSPPTLLYT